MPGGKRKIDPIPEHFNSVEEASDFWDTHSLADYWDQTLEAQFDIEVDEAPRYIVLERGMARQIEDLAARRKVSSDVVVHGWLKEKLLEAVSREAYP